MNDKKKHLKATVNLFCLQFQEVGLIRKPATFLTSVTDERGDELMYSGVKISEVVKSNKGIGGVLGLLWFQVCLHSNPKMKTKI